MRIDPRFLSIAVKLATHNVGRAQRRNRAEHLHLLVAHRIGIHRRGRLHCEQPDNLQHVILYHIANRPGLFVKLAAAFHAKRLGHGDLHAVNVIAVPDGLEKAVGEAENQQVLHRPLAKVVVDAEDVVLGKHLVQGLVQLAGRNQVASERFFNDYAGVLGAFGSRQSLHHHREHHGRDSEVVRWRLRVAQLGTQLGVSLVVGVVAVNVVHQLA